MPVELNSGHPALDRIVARRLTGDALVSQTKLNEACAEVFLRGSVSAAHGAATVLLESNRDQLVARALRSLGSIVPPANASALASVAARLAITRDPHPRDLDCGARDSSTQAALEPTNDSIYRKSDLYSSAITSFAYSNSRCVRSVAVEAILKELEVLSLAIEGQESLENLGCYVLERLSEFFGRIFHDRQYSALPFHCVQGLCKLANRRVDRLRVHVIRLLVELAFPVVDDRLYFANYAHAEDSNEHVVSRFEDDQASFVIGELATVIAGREATCLVSRRCLLRVIEVLDVRCFATLWMRTHVRAEEVLSDVGWSNTVSVLCVVATIQALLGNLLVARDSVYLANQILQESIGHENFRVNGAVAAIAQVTAVAVGALASSGGPDDLSQVCLEFRNSAANAHTSLCTSMDTDISQQLRHIAVLKGCYRSSFILGFLSALFDKWNNPPCLAEWLQRDMKAFCDSWKDVSCEWSGLTDATSSKYTGEDCDVGTGSNGAVDSLPSLWAPTHFALCCAFACCSCMMHPDQSVRKAASTTIAAVPFSSCCFLFFPVLLELLSKETNGVVASEIIRISIASSQMVRERATAKPVLWSLVNLMSSRQSSSLSLLSPHLSTRQTCLSAFAHAACIAPSSAMPILLQEIEHIHSHFAEIPAAIRTAAMACASQVVARRPARGPSFIPLTQKCITAEAALDNPTAAALSFAVMREMITEQVLDAAKAIKYVLKTYEDPLSVPSRARQCYFSLLGSASNAMNGRMGRSTAVKAAKILRCALVHSSKQDAKRALSWPEIGQAATSLAEFDTEFILRTDHIDKSPEADVDKERERLEEIEHEVFIFTSDLLSLSGSAQLAERTDCSCKDTVAALVKLLEKIAVHEWRARARGQYDGNRLSRLKTISEALRRARVAKSKSTTGADSSNVHSSELNRQSDATLLDIFSRSVTVLPDGAIKSMALAAGYALVPSDGTTKVEIDLCSSMAGLGCLIAAGAFPTVVPWHNVIEQILDNDEISLPRLRTLAARAVFALPQERLETIQLQQRVLLADTPPLFVGETAREAMRALLGIYLSRDDADGGIGVMRTHREPGTVCDAFADALTCCAAVSDAVFALTKEMMRHLLLCLQASDDNVDKVDEILERVGHKLSEIVSTEQAQSTFRIDGENSEKLPEVMLIGALLCRMAKKDTISAVIRLLIRLNPSADSSVNKNVLILLRRAVFDAVRNRLVDRERTSILIDLSGALVGNSSDDYSVDLRSVLHSFAIAAAGLTMLAPVLDPLCCSLRSVRNSGEKDDATTYAENSAQAHYEQILALAAVSATELARGNFSLCRIGEYCQQQLRHHFKRNL